MADLRELLDRTAHRVDLEAGAFDRMVAHRTQAEQRRRVAAGAVGLLIATVLVAAAVALAGSESAPEPATPPITSSNVFDLSVRWHGDLGAEAAPPTVAEGMVISATADGNVVAFAQDCASSGESCSPAWTAKVDPLWVTTDEINPTITWWLWAPGPPNAPLTMGAFAAVDGVLYTQSKAGTVYAFDAACRADGGTCTPLWTGDAGVGDPVGGGLPIVGGDTVYVVTDAGTTAFPVGCASDGSACTPSWRSASQVQRVQNGHVYALDPERGIAGEIDPTSGASVWSGGPGVCCGNAGLPIRFGDSVYVNFGSELDVFPADCSGTCEPTWRAELDDPFVDGPVVVDGAVVLSTALEERSGSLIAFPVDCASGGSVCSRSHRTQVAAELTTNPPVVADGLVYVVSTRGSYVGGFAPGCLLREDGCEPAWAARPDRPWQPIVANGVAFVSDSTFGTFAYLTTCADDPCPSAWRDDEVVPEGPPALADGLLVVTDRTGMVWAYASGPEPDDAVVAADDGIPWVLPAILLVIGLGAAAIIARRRSTTAP
jgi:hypothetical protein